jgi:uncharacterized coiled-coil DUF342 family protein
MGEAKLRLLEDRVLQAVAQVRTLREERDRTEDELRELRRRLEELEREGVNSRRGLPPEKSEEIRRALEAAIRDLREDDAPAAPREVGAPPAEREA